MQRWEYCHLMLNPHNLRPRHFLMDYTPIELPFDHIWDVVKSLGKTGWELVAVTNAEPPEFFFKRPKQE